jgi:hypothetical protein
MWSDLITIQQQLYLAPGFVKGKDGCFCYRRSSITRVKDCEFPNPGNDGDTCVCCNFIPDAVKRVPVSTCAMQHVMAYCN